MAEQNNNHAQENPIVLLAIAWAWAVIPLAWGVYQTLVKAMALFQ